MHLLILGYSSIVRRRVLPAARAVAAFGAISIASRSHGDAGPEADVAWFPSYDDAISSSGADLVYVSGINSTHAQWVEAALDRGCHVMVDKPALPDLEATQSMAALARRRRVGLAEATVFAFHPQVRTLKELIGAVEPEATRVSAVFSVPPLPAGDFRYRTDCGGGSLSDLGPYAVAVSRVVFGAPPATVSCRVLTRSGMPGVDTSFSVLMTHQSGGAVAGHFGFTTAYQNRLSVLTRSSAVDVDRIFTSAPDAPAALHVRDTAGERLVTVPAADAFAEFLGAFASAADRGAFDAFESAMLADAALLDRLRQSARE
jgi:predicted dehydrogenase